MTSGISFVFLLVAVMICVDHVCSQISYCQDPCSGNPCPYGETCESFQAPCSRGAPFCCPIARCTSRGPKPGACPYVPPGTPATCQIACRTDRDCDGSLKCCSNGCGIVCRRPVFP